MSRRVRNTPLITDRKLPARLAALLPEIDAANANDDDAWLEPLRRRFPEYRRRDNKSMLALIAWARASLQQQQQQPILLLDGDDMSDEPQHAVGQKRPRPRPEPTTSSSANRIATTDVPLYVIDAQGARRTSAVADVEEDEDVVSNLANASIRQLYAKTPIKVPAAPPSIELHARPSAGTTAAAQRRVRPSSSLSTAAAADEGWVPEFTESTSRYSDLGGIASILQDVRELIEYPLTHPELYAHLGVDPPRGILLHGQPGCGKTALAHAIAGELQARQRVAFISISAPEIVSGMSGESEAKIRTLFATARAAAPCLIFIDEIDAIMPKRAEAQREMERRIVAQMLTAMDSLAPKRRIYEESLGDELHQQQQQDASSGIVLVIGATNRPDSLDSALRRAGRFDREIAVPLPDEAAREQILRVMSRGMRLEAGLNWSLIAAQAVGYVGADLAALMREAAVIAVNRIFRRDLIEPLHNKISSSVSSSSAASSLAPLLEPTSPDEVVSASSFLAMQPIAEHASMQLSSSLAEATSVAPVEPLAIAPLSRRARQAEELIARASASLRLRDQSAPLSGEEMQSLFIMASDFQGALNKVQASSKREGFVSAPDVSWSDIGALESLREELTMHVLQPIKNPAQFEALGLHVPAGVLLFGPPGCGKTLVAKAIANESGASFLSVKGPELLDAFVGQSERAVRRVFQRARASSPCVIFFDELDALCPKRGAHGSSSEGSHVSERVVNQLLTEMDGLEERKQVFVLAATNRPDMIDPAMLRPGRLEKLLYVPLPSTTDRIAILDKQLLRTPLAADSQAAKAALVHQIASDPRCERFSGADCAALVREAAIGALRRAQLDDPLECEQRVLSVRVAWSHFDVALSRVFPSVSKEAELRYSKIAVQLRGARAAISNV